MLKKLLAFERILNYISVVFVVISITIMSIIVFYATVQRYAVNSAPFWVEEISRYFMVWMALIGASIAFRYREHVGLTFFVDRIPAKIRRWIVAITDIASLIFFGFVIIFGAKFAYQAIPTSSPVVDMSLAVPYAGVPVGCFFCFIQIFINLFKDFSRGKDVSTTS
jgi:TRAP-type C4-dicarboxylate transport system permease small subunit